MAHAKFNVTVKALVQKEDKFLTLTMPDGQMDFPGGRFNEEEYDLSFTNLLERELREELGTDFKYKINDFIFPCKLEHKLNNKKYITVAIFYLVEYIGGNIELSNEHIEMNWLSESGLISKKNQFMSEDLYNSLINYFRKK